MSEIIQKDKKKLKEFVEAVSIIGAGAVGLYAFYWWKVGWVKDDANIVYENLPLRNKVLDLYKMGSLLNAYLNVKWILLTTFCNLFYRPACQRLCISCHPPVILL